MFQLSSTSNYEKHVSIKYKIIVTRFRISSHRRGNTIKTHSRWKAQSKHHYNASNIQTNESIRRLKIYIFIFIKSRPKGRSRFFSPTYVSYIYQTSTLIITRPERPRSSFRAKILTTPDRATPLLLFVQVEFHFYNFIYIFGVFPHSTFSRHIVLFVRHFRRVRKLRRL